MKKASDKAPSNPTATVPPEFMYMAQQYTKLLGELRASTVVFNSTKPEENIRRLECGLHALRAVNTFLRSDSIAREEGLMRPLAAIESAAFDAGRGLKPALFDHPVGHNRKPDFTTQQPVQGAMAYIFELVRRAETGMSLEVDAVRLARDATLQGLRCADGSEIDKKQIIAWRKEMTRAKTAKGGGTKGGRETYDRLEAMYKPVFATIPAENRPKAYLAVGRAILLELAHTSPQSAPNKRKE